MTNISRRHMVAYPNPAFSDVQSDYEGAELRDVFAAHAMAGLLSQCRIDIGAIPADRAKYIALSSYVVADAMMAARAIEPEKSLDDQISELQQFRFK